MKSAAKPRTRRAPEQLIEDLQKRIESIKTRAEQRKVKKSPVLRHLRRAVKSLDAAVAGSEDAVLRKALEETRSTLTACLGLHGVLVPRGSTVKPVPGRRSRGDADDLSQRLLDYLTRNPGKRGEHIAADIGTDTRGMRGPMKTLIAAGKVRTEGQRRGMTYFAV